MYICGENQITKNGGFLNPKYEQNLWCLHSKTEDNLKDVSTGMPFRGLPLSRETNVQWN